MFIKSPLNYTGGKFKLLSQLLPLFPQDMHTFVDLFCGGCNVGINVQADRVIFNDITPQLYDLYRQWQKDGYDNTIQYVENRIQHFQLSKTNEAGFLQLRETYNAERDIRDLFVLIAYAFNHQIRFNSAGNFNMPFGRNRSEFNKTMKKNLEDFVNQIVSSTYVFMNQSFEQLDLSALTPADFVYCDPPYLITTASYNENDGWNEACEYKLLGLLDQCNARGIRFGLSNVLENKGRKNDILIEWIDKNNYKVHHLHMTYGNCNYHALDKSVGTTDEVLITNY